MVERSTDVMFYSLFALPNELNKPVIIVELDHNSQSRPIYQ